VIKAGDHVYRGRGTEETAEVLSVFQFHGATWVVLDTYGALTVTLARYLEVARDY